MSRQSVWSLATFCLCAAALLALPSIARADGYESPQAAGTAFMEALKAKDVEKALPTIEPDRRDDFRTEGGEAWFQSITLHSYEFVSVKDRGDEGQVVAFNWKVDFDVNAFLEAQLKKTEEALRASGATEDEIKEEIEGMRAMFAMIGESLTEEMAGAQIGLRCVQGEDERWYVADMVSPSQLAAAANEEAIRDLVSQAMTAVVAKDAEAFADLMHEDSIESFQTQGGAAMLKATTVTEWEIDYVEAWDPDYTKAIVQIEATFDREVAAALFGEMMRAQLKAAGLSDDDVAAQLEQQAETIAAAVEQAARVVEAGRMAVHLAKDSDGNWRITSFQPEEDWTEPGGGEWDSRNEEIERTVAMMLDAVKAHNEDRILALVPPAMRDMFVNEGELAAALAVSLSEYATMDTGVEDGDGEDPTTGWCTVWWSASFDAARFVELASETMRKVLTENGLGANDVEEAVKAAQEMLAERAAEMASKLGSEYMRFEVVLDNGCWYVTDGQPTEGPEVMEYGAESPQAAYDALVSALTDKNWDLAYNVIAGEELADTASCLLDSLAIDGITAGEWGEGEDGTSSVQATITGKLNTDSWAAYHVEAACEMMYANGASDDDVNAARPGLQDTWAKKAAEFAESLAAGRAVTIVISDTGDGRYVVTKIFGKLE